MLQKVKWLAVIAVFSLVAGCSGLNGEGKEVSEGDGAVVEEPAVEEPAVSEPEGEPEPVEEPAEEAPADEGAEGEGSEGSAGTVGDAEFVAIGEPKEIETMIEGMAEKVSVTPYTIGEFGISYDLRTDMGAPEAAADKQTVKYATQMGDEVAVIEVQVLKNTTVNDAVAAMKEQMADDGYGNEVSVEDMNGGDSLPFKMANYQKDGYFAGFKVFGAGDHALVVSHSYPFEAADGMAAVLNEMLTSLKVAE